MSHDPSCIFCKIVAGQIPCARVLETDRAIAFLDINPVNKGHVLIVPKDHHARVTDLPDTLSAHLGELVPRVCRAVQKATDAAGLNLIANVGAAAGQTVDHVHYHIIPRHVPDAIHWPWPHVAYHEGELAALQNELAAALHS